VALIKSLSEAWNPSRQGLLLPEVPFTPISALFFQKTNLLAKFKKEYFVKLYIWGDGVMAIKRYRWEGLGIKYL
jgi:hypothetical protein